MSQGFACVESMDVLIDLLEMNEFHKRWPLLLWYRSVWQRRNVKKKHLNRIITSSSRPETDWFTRSAKIIKVMEVIMPSQCWMYTNEIHTIPVSIKCPEAASNHESLKRTWLRMHARVHAFVRRCFYSIYQQSVPPGALGLSEIERWIVLLGRLVRIQSQVFQSTLLV
jgi:hypothetical protein